jgi:hypothetical protein
MRRKDEKHDAAKAGSVAPAYGKLVGGTDAARLNMQSVLSALYAKLEIDNRV